MVDRTPGHPRSDVTAWVYEWRLGTADHWRVRASVYHPASMGYVTPAQEWDNPQYRNVRPLAEAIGQRPRAADGDRYGE